jgi:uncharacterized delta-60 repeat protein
MHPFTARRRPIRVSAAAVAALLSLSALAAEPAFGAAADLDGGFGTAGLVTTPVGDGNDAGAAVAVQADGRIVVAGSGSVAGDNDFAVVRYDASGHPDAGFGHGGIVTDSFGAGDEHAYAVAIQPDQRIVVAGAAGGAMAVARYMPDGTRDASFDGDGHALVSFGSGAVDVARGVAVAPGGKIVVAGSTFAGGRYQGAAVRFHQDGSLDATLDGDGRMVATNPDSPSADVVADAVAVLGDGRIVLAGGTGPGCAAGTGACDFEISRWTANGSVDSTFDVDGESTTGIGTFDRAHAVVVQPDGKTVAAGVTQTGATSSIAVSRYTGEAGPRPGNLDKSFGSSGVATTSVGQGDEAWGLALQSDGKLLVGGTTTSGGTGSFVLLRYLADGTLDPGFGTGGKVATNFPGRNAEGRAIAIGPDGRWVMAGSAASGANADIAVARYIGQLSGRSLSASDASALEGSGHLVFTVNLASTDGQPVSVHYATADGSAKAPADYAAASGTLSFGPGETTRTVTVAVQADDVREADETVLLNLTNPSPADTVLVKSQLVGTISDEADANIGPGTPNPGGTQGYRLVASDGGIFAFGTATFKGSTGDITLNQPIVGSAPTPSGNGYWLLATDGGIFAFGDARFFGSTGNLKLAKPIVGMASTPSGSGYWLVASDGGIFAFGDAKFFGSTGNLKLAKPIVGMASTPSGNGYWMVASDGGIFAFGDASFKGSTGDIRLVRPIVGMTASPTGNGYWMVASDGGMFSFGDARFFGSTGSLKLAKPIVGMAATKSGSGYWLVANDGGIFAFGDAGFLGSTGSLKLTKPIVGMAAR